MQMKIEDLVSEEDKVAIILIIKPAVTGDKFFLSRFEERLLIFACLLRLPLEPPGIVDSGCNSESQDTEPEEDKPNR